MLDLLVHVRDHLALAFAALAVALAIGLPVGAAVARTPRLRSLSLGAIYVVRVVPSLAVLAIMLPLVGIGFLPSLVALALLAIPPIALNTDLGLRGVPEAVRDAARGLGMSAHQVRAQIDWPLALPVVFSSIRTAAVEVVASATLAAFIGGGGLGEYIVNGLAENDRPQLLEGAISVGILALLTQWLLGGVERTLRNRSA
ncbi:MAG: ABC transporter permease [Candidatus Eremiobacteraeota bacterium]|nr:ABC transporter permease [Candidatus Eremiobacteraeota bacterium]